MDAPNYHCCVLTVNGNGILIDGDSQSGKTSLMLGLLERAKLHNLEAFFISDDQALLSIRDGSLIAKAPETIAGKLEINGFGIVDYPNKVSCEISHVVRLIAGEKIERMPEPKFANLLGISLSLIEVPKRHEANAVRIVFASLNLI